MKYFMLVITVFFVAGSNSYAQLTDTVSYDAVVVSATKFNEQKKNVAQKIEVISPKYISYVNAQNTGDLLISTGNIFVQKSQQGGSSPVIRGFEASRVLLIVDGVRMNNAIYRAGHLQNVISVDQNMLERAEVMYGPSSTLYGSDALGGAIHLISKEVKLSKPGEAFTASGNAFVRHSTVNNEKSAHGDVNLGFRHLGLLTSFTYSDFGDMKMGNRYPDKYPDFGRRAQYVRQDPGSFVDTVVKNENDRVQRYSGYRQWDILQKVMFQQSDKLSHSFNMQFSNSSNIPRYDRLQDMRNGTLRYAEWYYGPQKRDLFAYTFNATKLNGIIDELRTTVNYQDIEESRQTRELKRYDRFDSRREHVKVWGAVADARKIIGRHELTVGADAQWNKLRSVADRTNLQTGAVSKLDSRYPNGKNQMNYYGVFAQHVFKIKPNKWVLNDGIRLQAVQLHSIIADNSFFNLPVTDIKQHPVAITGNIGIVHLPSASTKLSLNISSGFRAPNIDDLARVFESSSSLQRVVVPNPDIKPEYTYGADAGINHTIKGIKLEATAYYTLFRNAITLAPFQLNAKDSMLYNGAMCQVVANQNRDKAYVYGFNAGITAALNAHFSLQGAVNYTKGRFKTNDKATTAIYQKQPDGTYAIVQAAVKEKPLDHIPPVFGKVSVNYRSERVNAEVFVHGNGWKRLSEYNPDGEDNAQYATADGMPSWMTLNCRTAVRVTGYLELQVAVENILDHNYRYFASGFSAPGRNFMVVVRSTF
ncbi:hypothetical protein A3860_12485 [Niastella vici]|uniref:TonB-dependent receptor n=1 Tax=Niastella vici TaxID=1703345 RepID=A0A1V9G6Z3_9BACT|nr:TonB-dependent receptor [Niastella vici]OQP66314.1 hypothetical protein A3860_12485 [Niastella vici]